MSTEIELKSMANADWARSIEEEGVYWAIDGNGVARNICASIGSAAELVTGTASKVASVASYGIIPISFIVGGALVVGSAIVHTIPKAIQECRGAKKDRNIAMWSMDPEELKLADEGIKAAALGVTNQSLYGLMGAGMIQCGVLTLMSPGSAHLFGFTPLVSTGAAAASGGALGAIYAVRGFVVAGKSLYALHYLNKFENDFKASLKLSGDASLGDTVDTAIEKIENIGALPNALGRRIGNTPPKLPGEEATLEEKISYLEAVDKGIQERKIQETLGVIIGIAMILGGIAAIVACFVCPAIVPIISLVSGIFFIAMEGIYGINDAGFLFGKLRDKLYKPSEEIVLLRDAYGLEQTSRIRLGAILPIDLKKTA